MSLFYAYDKVQFLEFLLKEKIMGNDITIDFFKELTRNRNMLSKRVDFSKQALGHYKYSVTINRDKKRMFIRINDKFYSEERMLKYIIKGMIKNPEMRLNICIINTKNKGFSQKLDKLCHNKGLVSALISEASVDLVLNEVLKKNILKMIEKSLEDKDEKRFNELTEQYKQL